MKVGTVETSRCRSRWLKLVGGVQFGTAIVGLVIVIIFDFAARDTVLFVTIIVVVVAGAAAARRLVFPAAAAVRAGFANNLGRII